MKLLDRLKLWWQERTGEDETPFDGDTPAWVISLGVHLGLILLLFLLAYTLEPSGIHLEMASVLTEEPEVIETVHFSKDPQEKIGANSIAGEAAALAMAPILSEVSSIPQEINATNFSNMEVLVDLDLATAPNVNASMAVKGATGVGTTGASGAIDRITHEILLSLEERKTLVVWLFDQSGSLQNQRSEIYDRFDRIYEELGAIEMSGNEAFKKHDDKPLLTSVMAFGKNIHFCTEAPTDQLDEIKGALSKIENDPTGEEMVFSAIMQGVQKYQKEATMAPRRNVMFVVVSDEVGDDEVNLDKCIAMCQRNQMPVYVIGVPAPFGRREAVVKYVDPDPQYDQSVQWVEVVQGPETVLPERVKLTFSADRTDDLERLASGFGPFALTRLCYETGGIYFTVHANQTAHARAMGRNDTPVMSSRIDYFFDPAIMRRYRPDYVSNEEYVALLNENKARAALVNAAKLSWLAPMRDPTTVFPKEGEGELKVLLDEAQKVAAKIEPQINLMYDALKVGEKDRDKLVQPRWQAGYDLAMGRTLACKVRTETYNSMLAAMKSGRRFENEKSDTWKLMPSSETLGSTLEKAQEQAKMYLERVVKDHPDTPWALIAQRELDQPMGWSWEEDYTGVVARRMAAAAGNGNANPNPNKPKMMVKPKRPNVKL